MRLRILKERGIVFFLVLAVISLPSYNYIGGGFLSTINDPLRVLAALGAGFMVIKKRSGRLTPLFIVLVFMQLELMVSTIINGGSMWIWFASTCQLLAFMLIFETWSYDPKNLIYALMPFVELLCYGNYLTILLFPEGLYTSENIAGWSSDANWLLGYRTSYINYLLPACLIAFIYRKYGGKWWREFGIYVVSFITVSLPPSRSATSAIGLTVFLIMLYLIRRGYKFNVYLLVTINVTLFFVVVVFRLHEVFLGLIGEIFEKNIATLSGRTVLWDNLFRLLKESPLFGYGVQTEEGSVGLLVVNYGTNGHNLILQYLYQGGAILLALYFCMMIIVYRHLKTAQEYTTAQAISAALFVFQIMALLEAYQHSFVYLLYYLAYFAKRIAMSSRSAT